MKVITLCVISVFASLAGTATAQQMQWDVYKISNTGIPGGEDIFAKIDPEGDIWVSSTDPWNPSGTEGGVAEFDGITWTNYANINSPLRTPHVASVAFDDDGTEWIATNAGLVRKRDNVWTTFTSQNSGIANNSMGHLAFDSAGGLWMLHWNGAVSRYSGAAWRTWSLAQLGWPPTIVPSTLVVDAQDDIWVGTEYAGGLSKLDWGTVGPNATWQIHGNGAPHLFFGDDGKVWAIDLDINLRWAIWRYDEGLQRTKMPDFGPGNIPYSTLRILSDGTYWAGTFTGLVGYYDGTGFAIHQFGGSHVYSIDVAADGHAWVSGKGGTKKLDPSTGQWTYFNLTTTGLADRGINNIEFDVEGRAWLATTVGGLSVFDGTTWTGHSPYNGGTPFWPVSNNGLHDGIAAHPDGDVWVGADISGVMQWDGTQWTQHHLGSFIDAVAVAADGSVWAGPTAGGLSRWDGTSWSTVLLPLFCEIRQIYGASNGDVFVCDRCALHRWDGTSWTRYTTANTGMVSSNVNDFDIAPDGSWWIATTMGLTHFDGTNWTTYNEANSGVPADVVSCVAVTPTGDVWCGAFNGQAFPSYGGVAHFDGANWTTYGRSNSPMEDDQIYSMDVDPQGNVWIGSALGGVMVARVGQQPPFPDRWTDLGNGLAGADGVPLLTGHGSLTSGTTFGLKLEDALREAAGAFILGGSNLSTPILGGVLVPTPQAAVPIMANSAGRASLVFSWPAGIPSGLELYAQAWLLDSAAVQGASASNAVVGKTP